MSRAFGVPRGWGPQAEQADLNILQKALGRTWFERSITTWWDVWASIV